MLEPLYYIPCSTCGHTIGLLETSLSRIVQCRRLPETGEPFLVLVCPGCAAAFRYDYQQRATAGVIGEGQKTEEFRSQTFFSVVAECDDSNCESLVELIAIRRAGTTAAQVAGEMPTWNLGAIRCKDDHPVLPPDPTIACEHSDTENAPFRFLQ